jgi:hypothetical protein
MKNSKKYATAMLAIVLCFPITTFAEESVETISATSADKITDIPNEPVQKDQISEHNMSDNPEGTSEKFRNKHSRKRNCDQRYSNFFKWY